MKVSKHIHSCLLVEDDGKTFLLDPGEYTYNEKALDILSINQLDYILYTHEHSDHLSIPFLKEILTKFPHAKIVTNKSIVDILKKEQITALAENDKHITLRQVPHEKIWMGQVPLNVMITINNKLSSPGDSLTFNANSHSELVSESQREKIPDQVRDDVEEMEVLALPIQAPWGHTTWAIETALKVKPKTIIPIHDYHWKDNFRKMMYERLEQYFAQYGIRFIKAETGQIFEV